MAGGMAGGMTGAMAGAIIDPASLWDEVLGCCGTTVCLGASTVTAFNWRSTKVSREITN